MPEEEKLKILISWLKLDIAACFSLSEEVSSESNKTGKNSSSNLNTHKLVSLIAKLQPAEQDLLKKLAKKLGSRRHLP